MALAAHGSRILVRRSDMSATICHPAIERFLMRVSLKVGRGCASVPRSDRIRCRISLAAMLGPWLQLWDLANMVGSPGCGAELVRPGDNSNRSHTDFPPFSVGVQMTTERTAININKSSECILPRTDRHRTRPAPASCIGARGPHPFF
jgi:hypothetical protein